jgi:solute carrier family 6 (neurotransmitter transporter)
VYTSTRIIRRHPNYTVCLAALVISIAGLLPPNFLFSRLLDSRIVGTIIICAMVFEIIATIWVYGSKNLFTDLEFSLGRPLVKFWLVLWAIIPLILVGFLVWWNLEISESDLLVDYIPKWLPIAVCLTLVLILACVEVGKQVDYNLISMIKAATKPSKEWGPADPLVRHAWKQWKSVCEHTGERDFTLRRRGTKDYTNSIKKGQYSHSHANKYGTTGRNMTTSGSNSPNYSASIFGDSAIEEDISVDKFPNYTHRCGYSVDVNEKQLNQSPQNMSTSRKTSMAEHSQVGLITSSRKTSENSFTSRIEIMPEENLRPTHVMRNPMAKYDGTTGFYVNGEHIAWRMMASEEFSTEL